MEYKDYYKILGVNRQDNEDQIKRAYRKLALKYHPDRNPGDKKSEERFKEINEAYQVLSDPAKRSRYDQLGESYFSWQQRGAPAGGFNWEDWFATSQGGNVRVDMGGLEDILGGGFSEFFSRIFGGMPEMRTTQRGYSRSDARQRQVQKPVYQQEVNISLHEAYQGCSRRLDIDGRRLEVKIPAGARTGTKIRMANAVSTGMEGRKGDLYLIVKVEDDPRFDRKGEDLTTEIAFDLFTAVLGGELIIPTPSGNVVLTIPPGTQPGQTFRLAGRGMPQLKNPHIFGDLFVRAKVSIPRELNARQKDLFRELAKISKK